MKFYFDEKGDLRAIEKLCRLIIGIVLFSLACLFAHGIYESNSLSKHAKITNAIVVKVQKGLDGYAFYEYCVDGKKYNKGVRKRYMPYRMQIGDTIRIYYDSTRVNRSRPVDL
jgi:hypothetical protein